MSFRRCRLPEAALRLLLLLDPEHLFSLHLVDTEAPEWWLSELRGRPRCDVSYYPTEKRQSPEMGG